MQTANLTSPTEAREIRVPERVTRLQTFANDLKAEAGKLEAQITQEEKEAGNKKDPTAFDYPMTARSMRARLKNIRVSIDTLETELAKTIVTEAAKVAA